MTKIILFHIVISEIVTLSFEKLQKKDLLDLF